MLHIRPCLAETPNDTQASYEAAIAENPANAMRTSYGRTRRSVGAHTKYWKPGRTLKIAIPRYSEALFDAVKAAASEWLPYVNLKFEFVELDDNDELYEGDIRVNLTPHSNGTGSSRVGTDALLALAHHTTMELGTDHTSPRFMYAAIHEFGHALGLEHEHQHPDANIPWDREKTYKLYCSRFGWSRAEVDVNVLPLARNENLTYTPYDRHSIMHYKISSDYTLGDWEQAENTQLSAGDKAFAQRIYPK